MVAAAPRASAAEVDPLDWPAWRGPEGNGISRETGIIDQWDPSAEGTEGNVLWRNSELAGIATPIVMQGKLYTIVRSDAGTPRDCEKVVCVDAATGKKIWENRDNVFLSDVPAERIGWASCAGDPETGKVYAIGACGLLRCLDGTTGETQWSCSLNEEYGLADHLRRAAHHAGVVRRPGDRRRRDHRLGRNGPAHAPAVGLRQKRRDAGLDPGYEAAARGYDLQPPTDCVLDGQAAIVFGSGDGGVHAWQPRTGKEIWNFDFSLRGLNVSPVVVDNRVYTSQAEENAGNASSMGSILCIDGSGSGDISKTGQAWRQPGMVGKSSPLVVDGRVYEFDDGGKLHIIDAKTGEMINKRPIRLVGTIMRSSPLYADGKIYACTTSAWHVLVPTEGRREIR